MVVDIGVIAKLLTFCGRLCVRCIRWGAYRLLGKGTLSLQDAGRVELGRTTAGAAVMIDRPGLGAAQHALILGATGARKTTLSMALVRQWAQASKQGDEQAPALVALDAKGDWVTAALGFLGNEAPELLSKVTILRPFEVPFPFNPCRRLDAVDSDIRALQIATVVAATANLLADSGTLGVGARQIDVMSALLRAVFATGAPGACPQWAAEALEQKGGLMQLADLCPSGPVPESLRRMNIPADLRSSVASRLRMAFSATEGIGSMLSASSCINWGELAAPGRMVLVDLGSPPGGMAALQYILSGLLMQHLIEWLYERPSPATNHHHIRLVLDEAQIPAVAMGPLAAHLYATARSRNISITMLSVGSTLLRDASKVLWEVAVSNSRVITGRLGAQDAKLLATTVSPGIGIDETIGAVAARFTATVCNLPAGEFIDLSPRARHRFVARTESVQDWDNAVEGARAATNPAPGVDNREPLLLEMAASARGGVIANTSPDLSDLPAPVGVDAFVDDAYEDEEVPQWG